MNDFPAVDLSKPKQKHPASVAWPAAKELVAALAPWCEPDRLLVAGSLRRGKSQVSDIEILYVPKFADEPTPGEMFGTQTVNLASRQLLELLDQDEIAYRLNVKGQETWGEQIKLGVHVASNVPVDFFQARPESWWNYLVCRTGPAESNLRIATAARARGWKWEPYSSGFVRGNEPHDRVVMESERAVFEFVGLPYAEPQERR